ncbi:MAG: replication-associated recombination protein A [Lachnospiraceae bacterium]|nr:replication-associated recombination protein A [Lachnospiraceae bacterium]
MNLFDFAIESEMDKNAPLAARLRPDTLDEVVGQEHILGQGKLLRRAISADKLSSVIFYGPPGTGKTTLAHVIANTTQSVFRKINATSAGKKDMEEVVSQAKQTLAGSDKKTILFIDEIHRFNKAQQDYLLPFVEDGTIILIGATTENPYFEVNRALISRSVIFELKPLTSVDILKLIDRAVYDEKKGMGVYKAEIDEEARRFLSEICEGDARAAINAIELAVLTTPRADDGLIHIDIDVAQECIQKRRVRYDKGGDNHYDTISAFIKSMRGSDPDAAVYYLARMLYAGEDPIFVARRIMICAAEDVGMADPQALTVAASACLVCERVGMPEARIPLAEAAVYVATAPKSNASYMALGRAWKAVEDIEIKTVPPHLQDASYKGARDLGHGLTYKYAHDYPGHYVKQQYLPDELLGKTFFKPGVNGYENTIRKYLEFCKKLEEGDKRM